MTTSAVCLRGIVKHYRVGDEEVPALKGVDLDLPQGAFYAVRGPSGSGKSTLLNLCGLIDRFDGGSYHLNGTDVGSLDEAGLTRFRRQHIGFIFQGYNLVPVMTAFDNVEYPLMLLDVPPRDRARRVQAMLEQVGLQGFGDRTPDHLSGGQRQRVAIARALVKSPLLVIADEPTANLDTATANQVVDLMKDMGKRLGSTFLIATHDDRMTAHCERVLTMTDGVLQ